MNCTPAHFRCMMFSYVCRVRSGEQLAPRVCDRHETEHITALKGHRPSRTNQSTLSERFQISVLLIRSTIDGIERVTLLPDIERYLGEERHLTPVRRGGTVPHRRTPFCCLLLLGALTEHQGGVQETAYEIWPLWGLFSFVPGFLGLFNPEKADARRLTDDVNAMLIRPDLPVSIVDDDGGLLAR